MRCILKTGQVFKIRGGIPISAARASVGGVWPRAKYGSAALYAGRSLVLSSWYRYCGTYNSPTDAHRLNVRELTSGACDAIFKVTW